MASYAHQNYLFHHICTGGDSAVAIVAIVGMGEWESVLNYNINFWFEKHVLNTHKKTLVDIFILPKRYSMVCSNKKYLGGGGTSPSQVLFLSPYWPIGVLTSVWVSCVSPCHILVAKYFFCLKYTNSVIVQSKRNPQHTCISKIKSTYSSTFFWKKYWSLQLVHIYTANLLFCSYFIPSYYIL